MRRGELAVLRQRSAWLVDDNCALLLEVGNMRATADANNVTLRQTVKDLAGQVCELERENVSLRRRLLRAGLKVRRPQR